MRLILENSRQSTVTIEDELQLITMYLELEHLRFEGQFDRPFDDRAAGHRANVLARQTL